MANEIRVKSRNFIKIDNLLKNEKESLVQPERQALLKLLETHRVSKICQKLTLMSLNMHASEQKILLYKSITECFSQYQALYREIQSLNNSRLESLSQLVSLSDQQKSINKKFISDAYDSIEHYRETNLQYIEAILKLCKLLSNNNPVAYENTLKKSSRIFIKLQANFLNSNILPYLLTFSETFDPLLIEIKGKNQYLNFKIQTKLSQHPQYSNRLKSAHAQIIRTISEDELKFSSLNSNKIQQIQNYTAPFSQNNNELVKPQTKNIFDSQHSMELKSIVKFKIRQNRLHTQPKDNKDSRESSSEKIVQNFRKKSLQHRLATSFDQQTDQPSKLQRATISTENYHEIHRKTSLKNQRYMNAPKKLNFRAVNLEPLENPNIMSSVSSGNIFPVEGPVNPSEQRENKFIFKLKRKSKKQVPYFSRTQKSVEEEFSDFDSPEKTQKSAKKQPNNSSNKLMFILSKRKYKKFESDEDFTSGISDDSSAEKGARDSASMIRKRSESKKKSDPIIDESIILQYRKRRISEAEEDSNKSLTNKQTSSEADLERELSKMKIRNKKKDEEDTLGSTTNIQSKGEEISEYSCTQQVNYIGQNSDRKKQMKIQKQILRMRKQNPIPGISGGLPGQPITEKESSESQNTSLQRVQQQKPQENKIKRKIILKASKVSFQEVPIYLEKLGFLNFDSIMKDIADHQHYICEFYLNQTIFNIILFSPSLDFKSIQVKLIHEIPEVDKGIFESPTVKEKFRKVVIKNYIQIMEKSASLIFSTIVIKNPLPEQMWIKDCEFVQSSEGSLVYTFKSFGKRQKTRQFLTIQGSIFSVQQQENESFLYSDQISTFRGGKYDINDKIFVEDEFNLVPSFACKGLTTMKEINEILELKELDTFEVSPSVEALIFKSQYQEISQPQADLRTFTLQQILSKDFIISNGWVKTTSQLIFNQKNQKIASIKLPGNYQIHFGKGFEHIGTMKNKLTHYKTRMNSKKQSEFVPKIFPTKIRMFSKQLYGLIKHENGTAFYGNWEMNFHFKHEFLGRIVYSIETSNNQNRLIFGNSTFFVTIYQGDQFVIGWEVEENDFLY